MTAGRPTKYKPEFCNEVIDYMGQGFSKEAFAGHVGVSKQQIWRWMKKYREFRTSIKKAETACQAFWEEMGIQLVLAGQGNATAWIYNMKCRFRKSGWADVKDVNKNIYHPKSLLNALHNNNSNQETVETQEED